MLFYHPWSLSISVQSNTVTLWKTAASIFCQKSAWIYSPWRWVNYEFLSELTFMEFCLSINCFYSVWFLVKSQSLFENIFKTSYSHMKTHQFIINNYIIFFSHYCFICFRNMGRSLILWFFTLVVLITTAVMQYALDERSPLYWVCLAQAPAWNSGKVLRSQNNCLCFSSCCICAGTNRCVPLFSKTTLHSSFSEGWSGNHFSTSMHRSGLIKPPSPLNRFWRNDSLNLP